MLTPSTHHDGIDRIVDGVDTVRHELHAISLARFLPATILTGAVTAILVGASHLLSELFEEGAVTEWLLMWGIALVAVWVLAGQVHALSAALLGGVRKGLARWAESRRDARYLEFAMEDPRVLADLRAARLHAEWQAETKVDA